MYVFNELPHITLYGMEQLEYHYVTHFEGNSSALCLVPTPQHSSHPKGLHTLWTFHTESPVYSTPFVSLVGGTVCVCCVCSTGLLHLLELGSGAVLGSVRLPGEVFSSPVVRQGRIVVGCRDDKVYAVDIVSGHP